ncbi:MAG TPA: spondin domain-containing protein [Ferruginibacter sp.]|nr:spondin domain-containing protein [Ferruginibacter sp.]
MTRFFLLFIIISTISCRKEGPVKIAPLEPSATYKAILTTKWSLPAFSVPPGAHLTTLVGMVHAKDTFLWSNMPAGTGLEFVAEVGSNWRLINELDTIINRHKALYQFAIPPPVINSAVEFPLTFTSGFPSISFASMVAPSPDWFTGINNYCLVQNNQWVDDISIAMLVYDAGTEDGDVFGYDNPATFPVQNVSILAAANATVLTNGNPVVSMIATLRLIRN